MSNPTPNLSWRDAIIRVLEESTEPMHYADIADKIAEGRLRIDVGGNPAATVNGTIWTSMNNDADNSPFIRISRAIYWLRTKLGQHEPMQAGAAAAADTNDNGLINALGMYWSRDKVSWEAANPKILGRQQERSRPVDFYDQKGVYLLHNGHTVVYVGRTTDQPLGLRLRQHITDRLNARWDRFSWFGVYPATEDGPLNTTVSVAADLTMLIVTMEALLIEGLETPQNRKRGDDFRAVEFLQVEDPKIQEDRTIKLIDELRDRMVARQVA